MSFWPRLREDEKADVLEAIATGHGCDDFIVRGLSRLIINRKRFERALARGEVYTWIQARRRAEGE
jgi:hypothetical protein